MQTRQECCECEMLEVGRWFS